MNTSRALMAGVAGGAVMSILLFLARTLLGMDVNLEMMLGTMVLAPGPAAWMVGLLMHLMMSALIALAYAWGFEHVTHRANAGLGAAFSAVHIGMAGVVMGLIPALHPRMPDPIAAPGFFLSNHGTMGVAAFVMLHVVFGLVVGALYAGHVRHTA